MTEGLRAENLTVVYERVVALEDVSFSVSHGSMTAVVGPNGAGKSSLLKAAVGLVKPFRGRVTVLGDTVEKARGRIAYVPQREDVYWDYPLTVWDVVAMGRFKAVGYLKTVGKNDEKVLKALERTGLTSLMDRKISELSGGQQQRVFLARAIAQEAELYLLDEPLKGIDAESEDKLLILLHELKQEGKTIVMSTHDLSSTFELFENILLLRNRVVAFGPPEKVLTSENLSAAYGSDRVAMHFADVRRVAGWS
ncbi:MAG: metal ABC transporter ATP-binding protein [Candidatus Caldarchaeum sp.]|nr:metal ABC transporter ATP-binding protein [Candidatus Caldarchaeum sp.]MDW8435406.1 metal ABC transporter ATP-binding protein [Candidatus Caldarchaeum sp.]